MKKIVNALMALSLTACTSAIIPTPIRAEIQPDCEAAYREGDQNTCMACVIYHEARGETVRGQAAVFLNVMNRVESPRYPETICKVVYQKGYSSALGKYVGQYAWTLDGKSDKMTDAGSRDKIGKMLDTMFEMYKMEHPALLDILPKEALWFHSGPKPRWASKMTPVLNVGGHMFYTN